MDNRGAAFTPFMAINNAKNKLSSLGSQTETIEDILTPSRLKPLAIKNLELNGYKKEYDLTATDNTTKPVEQPSDIVVKSAVTPGTTQYKYDNMDVGSAREILDAFEKHGISVRVTSGLRPGSVTANGSQSRHGTGEAIDITPIEGQTWDDLTTAFKNNPELIQFMRDKGWGVLDETDPATMAKTGATGAHWHVGKDSTIVSTPWYERFA